VQGPGYSRNEMANIGTKPYVIGRGTDADLKLDNDQSISRHHVELTGDGACLILMDRSTYHNTMVNGVNVPDNGVYLQPGDQITVGNHTITIYY